MSTNDLNQSLYDVERDSIYYNRMPKRLTRTLYMSIFFIIIGIILLIAGMLKAISSDDIQSSFPYFILNLLCLIPGQEYFILFNF